jgi:hypothetical protein
MNRSSKRAGLALALVCLLSTPSCVTAALWQDPPHRCGHWSGWDVSGRVLLTPFAVVADVLLITAVVCAQCNGGGHCCR